MNVRLPASVDEIDAAWLTGALREGGSAEADVTNVEAEPLGAGTAFLGDLTRLTATHDSGEVESLIVKLPTTDPGGRAVGEMLNVWARESMFYAQLAPLVDAPLARCRFNGADPANDHFVLILDDLAPAEVGDQVAGADINQARSAVEALARFHAPWWGKPRTPDVAWVPGIDRPGAATGLQHAMANSLDRFTDRFGHTLPLEPQDWLRSFVPMLGDWRSDLMNRPLTIAHADYRLANLMFGPDGEVTILDWQTAMYTGGPTDLSFLLATNLDPAVRHSHEDELVEVYVATLRSKGVEPDAVTHIRDDYEHAHLWWMGMLANNLSSIETPDERSAALFDAMLTRLYAAAIDGDCGRFVS
ncbi:MAG: phosphotransferase [Acidimicrobiales bacterium]